MLLERLNLQGNNFIELPCTIQGLSNLAYLNLSHCHKLQHLPSAPTESGPSNSVGRYFKTKSGSRDHRSGLCIFDCPKLAIYTSTLHGITDRGHKLSAYLFKWLKRLVEVCIMPTLPYLPPLVQFQSRSLLFF